MSQLVEKLLHIIKLFWGKEVTSSNFPGVVFLEL